MRQSVLLYLFHVKFLLSTDFSGQSGVAELANRRAAHADPESAGRAAHTAPESAGTTAAALAVGGLKLASGAAMSLAAGAWRKAPASIAGDTECSGESATSGSASTSSSRLPPPPLPTPFLLFLHLPRLPNVRSLLPLTHRRRRQNYDARGSLARGRLAAVDARGRGAVRRRGCRVGQVEPQGVRVARYHPLPTLVELGCPPVFTRPSLL